MRLHIDRTACDGHGACAELLPDLLDLDEWGFPIVRSGERDPVLTRDQEARARRAINACPLLALRLV